MKRKLPASITGDTGNGPKPVKKVNSVVITAPNESEDFIKLPEADDIQPMYNNRKLIRNETISLSQTQMEVLNAIAEGKSVFFTGAAGSGKSHILKLLKDIYHDTKNGKKIAFTAPTGAAACNISGVTIHSWSGVGIAEGLQARLIGKVAGRKDCRERWSRVELLVIDEISMISADLFDLLSEVGKHVRNNELPFGGIQLVLCGDFFQLPPIGLDTKSRIVIPDVQTFVKFCFESDTWKEIFGNDALPSNGDYGRMITLDKIFRQKDQSFLNLLNEVRLNKVSPLTNGIIYRKVDMSKQLPVVEEQYTKLFAKNNQVDDYNGRQLELLQPKAVTTDIVDEIHKQIEADADYEVNCYIFRASDTGNEPYVSQLQQGCKAPTALVLKKGTQVMLLKNIAVGEGLANGARGKVIGFEKCSVWGEDSDNKLDYVKVLPVIEFTVMLSGRKSKVTRMIGHEKWDIMLDDKEVASRTQIPLMLAWAVSIHKSQGMTIPFLDVSMDGIFEFGQAYVALSRAVDLQNTIIRSYNPRCVRTHARVVDFYEKLQRHLHVRAGSTVGSTIELTLLQLYTMYGQRIGIEEEEFKRMFRDSHGNSHSQSHSQENRREEVMRDEYGNPICWIDSMHPVFNPPSSNENSKGSKGNKGKVIELLDDMEEIDTSDEPTSAERVFSTETVGIDSPVKPSSPKPTTATSAADFEQFAYIASPPKVSSTLVATASSISTMTRPSSQPSPAVLPSQLSTIASSNSPPRNLSQQSTGMSIHTISSPQHRISREPITSPIGTKQSQITSTSLSTPYGATSHSTTSSTGKSYTKQSQLPFQPQVVHSNSYSKTSSDSYSAVPYSAQHQEQNPHPSPSLNQQQSMRVQYPYPPIPSKSNPPHPSPAVISSPYGQSYHPEQYPSNAYQMKPVNSSVPTTSTYDSRAYNDQPFSKFTPSPEKYYPAPVAVSIPVPSHPYGADVIKKEAPPFGSSVKKEVAPAVTTPYSSNYHSVGVSNDPYIQSFSNNCSVPQSHALHTQSPINPIPIGNFPQYPPQPSYPIQSAPSTYHNPYSPHPHQQAQYQQQTYGQQSSYSPFPSNPLSSSTAPTTPMAPRVLTDAEKQRIEANKLAAQERLRQRRQNEALQQQQQQYTYQFQQR